MPIRHCLRAAGNVAPGLALAAALAAAAYALRALPFLSVLSPPILAIVAGIGLRAAAGQPARVAPGTGFAMRTVLRTAVAALGLQLTAAQVLSVGWDGAFVIVATLTATMLFTRALGRRLGVDGGLTALIAAGTSICGASAVVAANGVARSSEEDVVYAVAGVTIFGTVAMLSYPWLAEAIHLGPRAYGLWAGASIHEVAQVVAAGFQEGREAGEMAVVVKLSRVVLLAPVVMVLGLAARTSGEGPRPRLSVPWFVTAFLVLAALNSLFPVPPLLKAWTATATTAMLTVALAAMGYATDLRKLKAKGLRPFVLALAAFLFIAVFSLALVEAVAGPGTA
jgi:uncharacterized integral membrane protein (TIGR00698 family)